MIIPVVGKPRLFLRGQETPATIANGRLTFREGAPELKAGATGTAAEDEMPTPALAARRQPPTGLCLPTGGKGTTTLKLRNNTLSPITAEIALLAHGAQSGLEHWFTDYVVSLYHVGMSEWDALRQRRD